MKKTVIVAILLSFIASILVVQFFGLRVVEIQGNQYISSIEIHGMEYTNRDDISDIKYKKVVQLSDQNGNKLQSYAGYFVKGEYDKTPESLAANPNRVKILYEIKPYNATNQEITLDYDKEASANVIVFDEETNEFIFLDAWSVNVGINSHDGSAVRESVTISLVY